MRFKRLTLSLFVLLAACDQTPPPAASGPVAVGVTTLHSEPVTLSSQLPGRTTAVRTAEVRPQVSGVILRRLFTEGSNVRAGESLYLIDPASYQAAFDKAQATLENARRLVQRYKPLAVSRAISQQTYDDAVAAAKQAQADSEMARVNLNYTNVRAPISGRIGRSRSTEGALVTNGQSQYLTTLQQLDPIYVDLSESSRVLLAQRRALADGKLQALGDDAAAVTLTLEDGTPYGLQGRLEFSEVTVDESTGSVTMRALFPNPQHQLLPGMFVHASLPQGVAEQGILVPQQAIMHDTKGRPYVYQVNAQNKVSQQAIATGEMRDGKWLVLSGLNDGDRVVVDGLQNVRPGSDVRTRESQPKPAPQANLTTTDALAQ